MCEVASGSYTLGDAHLPNSRPVHDAPLAAYAIARDAVTNAQFATFVSAGGYRDARWWTDMGQRWLKSKTVTHPHYWGDPRYDAPEQPVVGVCWYEAQAFANWLAARSGLPWRLPTEAEWEAAAQGADADEQRINSAEFMRGRALPVHENANISWCGARHMCGNVYEWCSSRWGHNWQSLDYPYPYDAADGREDLSGSHARVMRGGSWFDPLQMAHPAYRARYLPGSRGSNIGFRLAHTFA